MTNLPSVLPPGLYEAAARRGAPPARQGSGSLPPPGPGPIPRQLTGQFTGPQRTQSPSIRPPYSTPPPQQPQTTGSNWLITPQEKARFDQFFSSIDAGRTGYLSGDQAVKFFSDSGLPEDTLASIWDLADINSEGQLSRDEFAVAMYLIGQQRRGAPLPAFLPPLLVPPSMRNQPKAPPQSTAPTFDNEANSSQLPKSATEDLFGLDNPSPPSAAPAQVAQSTGGSASGFKSPFDADPFTGGKRSSPSSPERQTFQPTPQGPASQGPTIFRPFMPTSAFGASLAAQHTGGSATSSPAQARGVPSASQQQPSEMDDLLGDNPEESKNITNETTELANMSNQIGNLRNQMQDVQTKKDSHERDLSATQNKKRDLEQRLAHFRAQYEQEVRTVKSLEEQLASSKKDNQRLQQELAMLEGTHQDLQNQHRQVAQALEADQRENTNLRQRISQLNAEAAQLKPQIEKMRSDARQRKGMVAINKKQLATNEAERDRLQSEMKDLKAQEEERLRNAQPPTQPSSTVASPAPSSNKNPFFRKTSQTREEGHGSGLASPSGFVANAPSPSAFDALFGPSFASQQQSGTSTPPVTSFGGAHAPGSSAPSGPSVPSEGRPTPSATPPLSTAHDSPYTNEPPPPPPESRQFTPNVLPFRQPRSRDQSIASSTRVVASGSRMGGTETPLTSGPANEEAAQRNVSSPFDEEPSASRSFGGPAFGEEERAKFPAMPLSPQEQAAQSVVRPTSIDEVPKTVTDDIPGAFPEDTATLMSRNTIGGAVNQSEPDKVSTNDDFDAAFAGFGDPSQSKGKERAVDPFGSVAKDAAPRARGFDGEFPPIRDLDQDDESESESETGFDDDFASGAPSGHVPPAPTSPEHLKSPSTTEETVRPSVTSADSTATELPDISAQKSPPAYEQSTSPAHGHRDTDQFPPEFGGLLPSREDPTSPAAHAAHVNEQQVPRTPSVNVQSTQLNPPETPASTAGFDIYQDAHSRPMSSVTETSVPAPVSNAPQAPKAASKTAFDDDFDDFGDLPEAKEAGGEGLDFGFGSKEAADEFNPHFDSPANSMNTTTMTSAHQTPTAARSGLVSNGFHDFESGFGSQAPQASQPSIATAFGETKPAVQQNANHDWDAIFSGLDTPAPQVEPSFGGVTSGNTGNRLPFPGVKQPQPQPQPQADPRLDAPKAGSPTMGSTGGMPQLGRAISQGTEHDDPILKRLTGMGYPRQQALDALEKFDYDINKVRL